MFHDVILIEVSFCSLLFIRSPGSPGRAWSPWSGATGPRRAPGRVAAVEKRNRGFALLARFLQKPVLGLLDHFLLRSRVSVVVQHLPESVAHETACLAHQISNRLWMRRDQIPPPTHSAWKPEWKCLDARCATCSRQTPSLRLRAFADLLLEDLVRL